MDSLKSEIPIMKYDDFVAFFHHKQKHQILTFFKKTKNVVDQMPE